SRNVSFPEDSKLNSPNSRAAVEFVPRRLLPFRRRSGGNGQSIQFAHGLLVNLKSVRFPLTQKCYKNVASSCGELRRSRHCGASVRYRKSTGYPRRISSSSIPGALGLKREVMKSCKKDSCQRSKCDP
uniref:Uncharacterized protein n=1 Tax=Anopheles albimanus TaxID=7167 RepID=A0A182F3W5_ANOAL